MIRSHLECLEIKTHKCNQSTSSSDALFDRNFAYFLSMVQTEYLHIFISKQCNVYEKVNMPSNRWEYIGGVLVIFSFSLKHPNALKHKRINRINGSTGAAKNVLPWSSKQVGVMVKDLQMKMKKPLVQFVHV